MSVFLSPVGGAGAQFFDNNGVVLSGGKLYTYLAGTTTPQATYTTSAGNTAWSNPIVFDAAGRVSGSGEIWLTDGATYKFVLKDTNDVLIATYDNVSGINITQNASNIEYSPSVNSLLDGVVTDAAAALDKLSDIDDGAKFIGYHSARTGAVPLTVFEKIDQYVSVLDFGADDTGAADSTAAFEDALATGKAVYAPKGTYKLNLVISEGKKAIYGDGIGQTILSPLDTTNAVLTLDGDIAGQIINDFVFSNFSIQGSNRQGNGFLIKNTADTHGCDQIVWSNIAITNCYRGIACYGRSIWNAMQNVFCDFNNDGIWIQTDQAVNTWLIQSVACRRNRQHGFYAEKTDVTISGFINFTFINFNSEYNGQDTTIPFIYGLYCNAAEGWSLQNVTFEQNGADLPGVESYGALFTGSLGRGVIIDGVWAVQSKYLITFSGQKKSGSINNVYRGIPYAGGVTVFINASWTTDEPKIELGPNIAGTVYVTYDVNGNWPITQGVDYYGGAQTSLSLKNRKNVTINTTGATSNIATITDLISGDIVFLYNYANAGVNKITLAAGLMASGVAYDINPDTGKQFMVLGFPHNGKLVPI